MVEEERIARAMARIEAAAARIEKAASSPAPTSASAANDDDLSQRHESLKREAWAALAELDGLIGTMEG